MWFHTIILGERGGNGIEKIPNPLQIWLDPQVISAIVITKRANMTEAALSKLYSFHLNTSFQEGTGFVYPK